MKTFFKLTGLAFCTSIMVVGCSSAVADKPAKVAAAETVEGYAKPGASVKLHHDFNGRINPSQVGDMSIDLLMPPTDGTVRVSFAGTDGLEILSGGSVSETQIQKAAFTSEAAPMAPKRLQFRASTDGVYYINAFIDVISESGETRSRVITIPVNVGTAVRKPANNGATIDNSTGRPVSVMSADETVNP